MVHGLRLLSSYQTNAGEVRALRDATNNATIGDSNEAMGCRPSGMVTWRASLYPALRKSLACRLLSHFSCQPIPEQAFSWFIFAPAR
jgi:hypothetical protein